MFNMFSCPELSFSLLASMERTDEPNANLKPCDNPSELAEGAHNQDNKMPLEEGPCTQSERDDNCGPPSVSDAETVSSSIGKRSQSPCSETSPSWLITEELAESFTELLNKASEDQLSVVISSSMQQDPQQIFILLKSSWIKKPKRLHFLFKVEDDDDSGGAVSIISDKGRSWGYLSFSTDLTSTIYGGFGSLPCNLLKFFLPVFKEVALLNGMQMAKNPPRPAVIPLGRKGMENDGIGK